MLELFLSEIQYGKATMPEACVHIAEHMEEPLKEMLFKVSKLCFTEDKASFGEVFRNQMEDCLRKMQLKKEERELFLSPFREQGFLDETMQLNCFRSALSMLQDNISREEQELRQRCRMAVGLGAMSGILLVVILL